MKKNLRRVLFSLCLAFSLVALFGALWGESLLFDASASGEPSSNNPRYAVNLVQPKFGGALEANSTQAERGSRVTITVTTEDGYTFNGLTVVDEEDNPLDITDLGGNKYRFIMPKGPVTVSGSFTWNSPYGDVANDDPNRDGIEFATNNGLMNGTGGGNFDSDAVFTRSQLVTVLWRMAGTPEAEGEGLAFSDVDPNGFYIHALAWATSTGVVSGYPDGRFGPDDPVTREQLAVLLHRRAVADGLVAAEEPAETDETADADTTEEADPLAAYPDAAQVALYARDAMVWAMDRRVLIARDGMLLPIRDCTRGEVATALYRVWG